MTVPVDCSHPEERRQKWLWQKKKNRWAYFLNGNGTEAASAHPFFSFFCQPFFASATRRENELFRALTRHTG
jgi:hypothetical protein